MSLRDFTAVPWLCRVCYLSEDYYLLELRDSTLPEWRCCTFHKPYPFVCEAVDFRWRVTLAFRLLSRFWLTTIRNFQAHSLLAPVSREIMIAASWVFGRDFSSKGAFYLRLVLTGFWGFEPARETTDREALRSMGLKMMPSLLGCDKV